MWCGCNGPHNWGPNNNNNNFDPVRMFRRMEAYQEMKERKKKEDEEKKKKKKPEAPKIALIDAFAMLTVLGVPVGFLFSYWFLQLLMMQKDFLNAVLK